MWPPRKLVVNKRAILLAKIAFDVAELGIGWRENYRGRWLGCEMAG